MGWFNKKYKRRQIIGVAVFGGSGSASSIDIETEIPKDWDTFWENIRSDFKDVVLTDPDGNVLSFQRKAGANYADRILTLQVDNYGSSNDDSLNAIYLYYQNPDESVDRTTSITVSSVKTGHILLEKPFGRIVPGGIGSSASDQPLVSFTKATGSEIDVFFITDQYFGDRIDTYNDRLNFEEMDFATATAFLKTGAVSTQLIPDNTYMRFGNGFVRARWKSGTNENDYAIVIKFVSNKKQTIETRAVMRVKDLLPS